MQLYAKRDAGVWLLGHYPMRVVGEKHTGIVVHALLVWDADVIDLRTVYV